MRRSAYAETTSLVLSVEPSSITIISKRAYDCDSTLSIVSPTMSALLRHGMMTLTSPGAPGPRMNSVFVKSRNLSRSHRGKRHEKRMRTSGDMRQGIARDLHPRMTLWRASTEETIHFDRELFVRNRCFRLDRRRNLTTYQ